jgi:hypothetical protein
MKIDVTQMTPFNCCKGVNPFQDLTFVANAKKTPAWTEPNRGFLAKLEQSPRLFQLD